MPLNGRLLNKRLLGIPAVLLAILVLVAGGGVYAALGGAPKAAQTGDINLQKGLVGWWKLDGNSKDSSPYGRDASVATGSPANTTDRKGKSSAAYTFDGSTYLLAASDPAIMTGGNETASWTYSVWAYTGVTNSAERVLLGKSSCNSGIITNGSSGGYQFRISTTNCFTGDAYINAPNVTLNAWHLLTATYSNRAMVFYVDGSQVGTASFPGASVIKYTGSDVGIGGNGSWLYTGNLDDARVYNRALSAGEAAALYSQYASESHAASGEKGLVGWWKLDGNAKDSSPYARNGTISNAALASDRTGLANSAYNFDGVTTTYITLADIDLSNAITVSEWVKPTAASQTAKLLAKHSNGADCEGTLGMQNGALYFELTTGGSYHNYASPISVPVNSWSHVAATYDGTNVYMYINGVQYGPWSLSGAMANNNYPWTIGRMPANLGSSASFIGSIDDVRIYNRALNQAEVQTQYKSYNSQIGIGGSPGSTVQLGRGLVGDWPFNGNAKDITPHGNNGSVNGAVLSADRKGRANSAYQTADSGGWVAVGSPSTFSNLSSSGFTYSIWVMRTGSSTYHWPQIMGSGNTHVYYGIRSGNYGDSIYFEYGRSPFDGSSFAGIGASSLPVGEWHMFTIAYDGSTLKSYWDGANTQSVGSITLSPTFGGLNFTSSSNGFNGYIDDGRVWNRALNDTEVNALYKEYR